MPSTLTASRRLDALVQSLVLVQERVAQAPARTDAELGKHLSQVILGRAGTDEELRPNFWVGMSLGGQPRDERFLSSEHVAGFEAAFADGLARRLQLASCAL